MSIVRVSTPCVVVHPVTKAPFALKPKEPFDTSDPLVRTFPWAFTSDVEQATAEPGSRRNR